MTAESPIYGYAVGIKLDKTRRYAELYNRRKSEIQMDVINKLVPKSARVEYQRLHWKDKNDGKLMISFCPALGFDFGNLPIYKAKIGRKTRKICELCKTPLVKRTFSGWAT